MLVFVELLHFLECFHGGMPEHFTIQTGVWITI